MHDCMSRTTRSPGPEVRRIDDWDDLRFFLAVLRSGSFASASRVLATDPSTVSRRIAAVETALGRTLFERGGRVLTPTAFATELEAPAREVEGAVLGLVDAAAASERRVCGRVRIALTEGLAQHVLVPLVLPSLLAAHPELTIELHTSDAAVDLARHEADVALRFFRTPKGPLVGQRVARLALAVLVARTLEKRLRGRPPADLPWIGYQPPGFVPLEAEWLARLGATAPRIVCTSVESQLAAVRAGLGVALASRAFLQVMPDLCELPGLALPASPSLEIFVVTRAAIRRVPRVAAVYEALVAGLRSLAEASAG